MKRIVMTVMMSVFTAQLVFAAGGTITTTSNDLRRMLYESNVLDRVTTMQVDLYSQDNSWHSGGSASFANDEANLTMDVGSGPGYYRGYANWNDKWGSPLFSSIEYKLTYFKAGMNIKDFPVYLNDNIMVHLKIEGPSSSDGVWVNGQQAWYLDGYWHVNINKPWLVDSLNIIWADHGGWSVDVSPSFAFDSVIVFTCANIDPTDDVVAQMTAVTYSGDDSWTNDVAYYVAGNDSKNIKMTTSIPYGTKVMVFFSYYDQNLGTTVEYYNTTVQVTDVLCDGLIILVPVTETWFYEGQSQIRLVYTDANGAVRQTWVPMPVTVPMG